MQLLKADTLVKVVIGPAVAVGDGFTPVTTLSLSTADEAEIMKHDAAAVTSISANTFAAITSMDGYYNLTITAAQLDTEGMLSIGINDDSLILPLRHDFMVVNANVYDSFYAAAATDYLQVDALQIAGTTQDATDLADFAAAGYDPVTNKVQGVVLTDTLTTYTGNTLQTGDNYARLGAPAGASVSADVAAVQTDTDDIQTRLPAALVGGLMSSDVTAISTDTTAANNLELQYDTTGLTGDTFPSTQSQLSGITNVGSAVHKPAASYTLTTGTQSANLFSDTQALNGTRHTHTDTAGAIEFYYEFTIGSGIPSSVQVTGYVNGGNDDIGVYGYDWVTTAWVQIGTFFGKNNQNNEVNSYDLFVDMVGSAGNEGVVRVRFYNVSGLTSATIAIDQVFVAFSQGAEGYENGAVWLDSNLTNTNTVVGVDGVSRNPVSTIAAVNTLLSSTNLHRVEVAPGSSFTFAAAQVDQTFKGHDWTLAFGGQDISGTYIEGATVSGIATSPTGQLELERCIVNTVSLGTAHLHRCGFTANTITLTEAGDYVMNECFSQVAGTGTPTIDFGALLANTSLNMAHYANGIQIDNLNATGTDNFSISGTGQIVYAASSSGTVNQRGDWRVTNTGGVTINEDDNTANLAAVLVDTADIQPKIGTPATDVSADIAAVKAETALIVADTNELQADWVNGGRLDLLLDRLITELDTATGEPAQGAPGVSVKRGEKIDWLYKFLRNRSTSTATAINVYADDATTIDHKSTHSDDGTTYDRTEFVSGP